MRMSMYGVAVLYQDDPWMACHYGVTDHPHYHDCYNCKHAKDTSCEYGDGILKSDELKKWIAVADEMLAAYPKLNPKRLP